MAQSMGLRGAVNMSDEERVSYVVRQATAIAIQAAQEAKNRHDRAARQMAEDAARREESAHAVPASKP